MKSILDDLTRWLAWRLPPGIVYWCAMRVASHACTGKYGRDEAPKIPMMEALDRWSKDHWGKPKRHWGWT